MQNLLKDQSRLWDYIIKQKLGKGEYGEVFLVVNKTNQQVFALKKMPISDTHEKQKLQAFKQIKCLKLLSHPSIIQYKQSFLSMDNIYIVMQYAAKGDFLKIIEQRRKKEKYYTQAELWKMFESIIKGVKYLHQKNIIHRDLKMENIFMMEDGSLKIGDLGMSKIMYNPEQLISTRVGTPIYFAPQMIKNQLYSFPVDVWALGCIFYNLTMLQHPFQDATMGTLAYYVIDRDPKPIKGNYSTQLIGFINSCLEKQQKNRPSIFQLALKLKDQNKSINQRRNKISIFNFAQLSKILTSRGDKQMNKNSSREENVQRKEKSQRKMVGRRFSSSVFLESPRKIYTSVNQRAKIQSRNIRSSIDKRSCSQNIIQRIQSPQSPKMIKRLSLKTKRQSYRPFKIVGNNMKDLNQCLSPSLIKSSGFNIQFKQKSISPNKNNHFTEFDEMELFPDMRLNLRKSLSNRRN